MKNSLLLIGVLYLFFTSCQSESETKEIPLDKQFEHEWHIPQDGDEAISITSTLIKNNIPAEEIYARPSIKDSQTYLIACKMDGYWKFYEVWTLSNDVVAISRKDVWHLPPNYLNNQK